MQDYEQACQFAVEQTPRHDVTFTWHYLDPRLSRRLSICFARQAIRLHDDFLEIPRFVAHAAELALPSYEISMGGLCLQASMIRDPGELYQKYAAMRGRMMAQDAMYTDGFLRDVS